MFDSKKLLDALMGAQSGAGSITDTLGNPFVEEEQLGQIYEPIAISRRNANKVKREERITVGTFQSVYRDYLKAIDPLIIALRNNDELAIEEFEDVYSNFSLEKQHAERMKQLLAMVKYKS